MPAPYTAFTFGDPAIENYPNNPYVSKQAASLLNGLVLGPSSAAPVVLGSALAGGTTGAAYSETITVIGGTAPYTYSTAGTLPPGLSFSSTTLTISGTPTTAGSYTFSISVTDANNNSSTETLSIQISSPAATGGNYSYVA